MESILLIQKRSLNRFFSRSFSIILIRRCNSTIFCSLGSSIILFISIAGPQLDRKLKLFIFGLAPLWNFRSKLILRFEVAEVATVKLRNKIKEKIAIFVKFICYIFKYFLIKRKRRSVPKAEKLSLYICDYSVFSVRINFDTPIKIIISGGNNDFYQASSIVFTSVSL